MQPCSFERANEIVRKSEVCFERGIAATVARRSMVTGNVRPGVRKLINVTIEA